MIEVLKQALKAFEVATTPLAKDRQEVLEAVAAINQAIAELESQEPVGWIDSKGNMLCVKINESCRPLYTHPPQRTEQEPVDYKKLADLGWQAIECGICGGGAMGYPQREWVGLTDEEFQYCVQLKNPEAIAEEVEAKLRGKNT